MLPGYTYIPKALQDHIHLGAVPVDGSDPTGFGVHNEPPYRINHVNSRTPAYRSLSEYVQSWDGTPDSVVLRDSLKVPIIFKDLHYQVRVDPEVYDLLEHLVKWTVYLVDHWHCNDSEDHSAFVRVMYFDEMSPADPLDQNLQHQIVNLTFLDMDTVSRA